MNGSYACIKYSKVNDTAINEITSKFKSVKRERVKYTNSKIMSNKWS